MMEELPFALASQVRTNDLTLLILAVSIFLSHECASKVLSLIGVKVSNDTIKRIYDKVMIKDNPNVEAVGIDDVAIRKGQTYATAIYDLNDRHLIALLDGRDAETLKIWLAEHPKIKLITRDRAGAYAKAINEVLPECKQVADRFHLLQNLVDRMRDLFKVELPAEIFIKDNQIMETKPKLVKVLKIQPNSEELDQYTYTNEAPVDENGIFITYDNKKHDFDSSQYKQQAESRKKKQHLIRNVQVRGLESQSISIKEVAAEFNIGQATVKKYLQMTEEDIVALDSPRNYKKRKTVMDDYLNMIYKMLHDKVEPAKIFSYVLRKGYSGSLKTLENYIGLLAKNNFNRKLHIGWAYKTEYPEGVTVINRGQILSYIIKKISEETKETGIQKHIEMIQDHYKIIAILKEAYKTFYSILMGKDPDKLDEFIETYELSPIKGFIAGIKKDIAPVKNAISHTESSGFVEGNNNKFKLLKRILYGRADLVNLFKKCYTAFQVKRKGFRIQDLLEMDELT